jgi:hypothetical protein
METREDIINSILSEMPTNTTTEVHLPSENKVYNLEDPNAPIILRPMTFEDEKAIISAAKNEDPMNLILQRCVQNIKIQDLLPLDKHFLVLKLREISYGDDYEVLLVCPECAAENPVTLRLSELPVNPVPDDFCDPVKVLLPKINREAEIRLPRVRDEKFFNDAGEALDQLWRFVVSIDGHTDKSIIAPVLEKLPLADIKTIMKAMNTNYGVETMVKLECGSCGGVNVVDMPISANFFGVS